MEPYECDKCKIKFTHSEDLQYHRRTKGHCRPYACTVPGCTYKAMTLPTLQKHSVVHAIEKSYRCDPCDFNTRHKGSLRNHLVALHSDSPRPRRFKCKSCDFVTHTEWQLQVHANKHTANPKLVYCDEPSCDWKSRWPASLIAHRKLHDKEKPNAKWFHCTKCDYRSLLAKAVQVHMRTTHSDQRPFQCRFPDCQSRFKTNGDRKKHENTHDLCGQDGVIIPFEPKRFPCNFPGCDYVAKRMSKLEEHKMRRHSKMTRTFVCNLCNDKSFCDYPGLQAHIVRCHTKERPHECDHPGCNFFAVSRTHLGRHKQSHSAEKPFHCEFEGCDFKTKTAALLKSHQINVHQVEVKKDFKCNFCSKSFRFYSQLENHISGHTKEKTYRCDACGYEAYFKVLLERHVCCQRPAKVSEELRELAVKKFATVMLTRIRLC